jgi:hypothetical protein
MLALGIVAFSCLVVPARADDDKEVCATSYENAQKLRRDGKLKDARKELVKCGNQKCPSVLVPYCVQMLHDVDEAMPSVLIVARDEKGSPTDDVRVIVDGERWADKLDGRPIPVDPGTHVLRVEHAGAPPWEDKVYVNEGEHSRRVDVSFAPKKPGGTSSEGGAKTAPPTTSPSLWPAGLMFGIGGAALVATGVMGGIALSTKSSLDKTCPSKTSCPASAQPNIDKLKAMGIGSTVSGAIGGAAVITGIVLVIVLPRTASQAPTRAFEIVPWVSPFGAGASGRF